MCATSRAGPGIGATLRRMANDSVPGEQTGQLEALLDRWQTSLDLHARYAALDDARYWHVQPWPRHERPQRWIIQLARKRILALKRLVAQRQSEGDRDFIEGIEIMGFLATMVGLTSVERFIPLATHETERRDDPERGARFQRGEARARRGQGGRTARRSSARRAPVNTSAPPKPRARCPRCPPPGMPAQTRGEARAGPPGDRQAPARRQTSTLDQTPASRKTKKGADDRHGDRTRGDRRRRALVRLGQAVARARGDDRAAVRAAQPLGNPPHPAHLPRPDRRRRHPPTRLNARTARPGRLARRRAPQQNLRPESHGTSRSADRSEQAP